MRTPTHGTRAGVLAAVLAGDLAAFLAAGAANAQDRVALSLTDVARPVQVAPGGEIVLRGQVRSSHDGAAIDAATTTTGEGASANTALGGLYDYEAGGWRLVSRDPRAHAYRLAATGDVGPACVEAHVASPCLPLRLLPLAQTRLLSVAEFARTLTGAMTLEVVNPDDTPPASVPVPGLLQRAAGPALGVIVLAGLGAAGARLRRRRAERPEARVRDVGRRVKRRLAAGDPVHRRLVPSVAALEAQADELATLRDKLRARVDGAARPAVAARRAELAARAGSENAEALALVDEQLARIDRWGAEADRAAARIDRILEYLRALDQRLDDAAREQIEEADARVLAELESDVQAALEGAREADRLVGPRR